MISIQAATSKDLLDKAFAIRRQVFVDEQKVSPSEEFDEFEEESHHFIALDAHGNAVGAARWRETGKGIKLERFAVQASQRGKGVGSQLVAAVIADIRNKLGKGHLLYLHAQLSAVPLYEKFSFQKEGDQFSECNILHYKMKLSI